MNPSTPNSKSFYHPLLGLEQIVAFDLETTGLRAADNEITQIAAVRLGGWHMKVMETFTTYVNPGRPIPDLASRITHIKDEDVKGAPTPIQALRDFAVFAGDSILLGHDIYQFDFKFIKKCIASTEVPSQTLKFIDTMDIFPLLWNDFSRLDHSLDVIAERLQTSIDSRLRHTADGDVLLLARIFHRIQTHPRLEEIAGFVPVHEGELPSLPINPSLN